MAGWRAAIPRSSLPLALLLLAALAWLWHGERGRRPATGAPAGDDPDGRHSGTTPSCPVPFPVGDLVSLEARLSAASLVLERMPAGGWRFARGCDDRVEASAAEDLAQTVCEVAASPLLPEEPAGNEAVELGLSGPEAIELRLTARDGRAVALTVGKRNPVLGACYARLAGRAGIWSVPYPLRVKLLSLPDAVRLRRLWPPFALAAVETLALRPEGAVAADLFARDAEGGWWLRAPADGWRRAGAILPAYARLYGDRVVQRGGVAWWRARDRALADLLFRLGEVQLRGFGPRETPAERLRAMGLGPSAAAVRVVLGGGEPPLTAVFGDPASQDEIFALREGRPHVLLLPATARALVTPPLADLLHADALPSALAEADSFTLAREGRAPVRAWRHQKEWATSLVSPPGAGPSAADLVHDLVLTFDRLPIVRPLRGPAPGDDPRGPANRVSLTAWRAGRVQPAFEARFGLLAGTSGAPAALREGETPAVVWFPARGQLLVVPEEIIVTLRTFFLSGGDASR